MTELETMLAVGWNSGDPTTRLALADALAEAGHEEDADRQRALAELLARHPDKFATVTVARDWREAGPQRRYRALLVADGRCHATGESGLTLVRPVNFWSGPAGEMWIARKGRWCHGYGCTLYHPATAVVEHLDFLGDSP